MKMATILTALLVMGLGLQASAKTKKRTAASNQCSTQDDNANTRSFTLIERDSLEDATIQVGEHSFEFHKKGKVWSMESGASQNPGFYQYSYNENSSVLTARQSDDSNNVTTIKYNCQ